MMPAEVFVSYSRKDQERIAPWLQRIQDAGVSVWIDVRGIDGAALWGQEIVEAIERCKVFMLVLSEASAPSPQVVKEVSLAAESNRRILPLLLDPVPIPSAMRYHLAGLQQIELFGTDSEEKLQAILRSLVGLGLEIGGAGAGAEAPAPAAPRYGISRIYLLKEQFSPEQMRERAWDQKANVFGGIINMIFRPRSEDIQLGQYEKRYEPFWHVVCSTRYVYDRDRQFTLATSGPVVKRVIIEGCEYPVRDGQYIILSGLEHCEENLVHEAFIDGVTSEPRAWKHYLNYSRQEISDLGTFVPEDAVFRPPETRASSILRQVLAATVRPVQPARVDENSAEISVLDLYLRPVYAFEYRWPSRGRNVVAEFDGLSGEVLPGGRLLCAQAGRMQPPDVLFDMRSETADLVLPGSSAAISVRTAGAAPGSDPVRPPTAD
jgi:hypothetical protein